jgi:glycosyltransferase involved in cell wall biosynthesis
VRIAIASDWFPPRLGGIEGQLLRLAEGLATRGHTVDVITSTPGAREGRGFALRPLDVARVPGSDVAMSASLVGALRQELRRGYDVVHAHVSVVSPVGYMATALARMASIATVITFHSVLRQKRHVLKVLNVGGGLTKSAVVWSAVSELVAGQVRGALDGADVAILPNGVDLAFWTARADRVPRADASVTLVSAMRLQRKKRPRDLLRLFASALARSSAPARLVVVGDGPERAALERETRDRGLTASVEFLGWLDPVALRDVYYRSDAFVMPSTRESFGIAALEARAAGLPVVAMRSAGSSEFLGHDSNALLCSDDADLARALTALIGDASLRKRLREAVTPLDRYDWAAVLGRHEAVYRRAVTRAASAGAVAGASA